MWQYNYTDELYHFGVPGMRWGKRKAPQDSNGEPTISRRQRKKFHNLERLELDDKQGRERLELQNKQLADKYHKPKQAKKLAKKIAKNELNYEEANEEKEYQLAKAKAKVDKSYKATPEYQKIRIKRNRRIGRNIVDYLLYSKPLKIRR